MSPQPSATFPWRGTFLQLLAEKAIWEPERQLLLLADLHLGKAETFQAHGIAFPSDGDAATLNTLLSLAHRLRPRLVVVLGDLIHSRLGITPELRAKLRALPELLGCSLRLIGGNHERGSWLECLAHEPSQAIGPFWLSHSAEPQLDLLNVCGHHHPVALIGQGVDRLRLPCFAYDASMARLMLPSFGELTGGHPCGPGEQLWLVVEGNVVAWPESHTQRRGVRRAA